MVFKGDTILQLIKNISISSCKQLGERHIQVLVDPPGETHHPGWQEFPKLRLIAAEGGRLQRRLNFAAWKESLHYLLASSNVRGTSEF
jgi:hypothetical protein